MQKWTTEFPTEPGAYWYFGVNEEDADDPETDEPGMWPVAAYSLKDGSIMVRVCIVDSEVKPEHGGVFLKVEEPDQNLALELWKANASKRTYNLELPRGNLGGE